MQPRGDGRQRLLRFELTTQPRARVFFYQDPLGNIVHHFDVPSRHSRFSITADAVIEIAPAATLVDALPYETWEALDALAAAGEEWDSLHPSRFARESPLLADLAHELDWQRHDDPPLGSHELSKSRTPLRLGRHSLDRRLVEIRHGTQTKVVRALGHEQLDRATAT